MRFVDTNVLIYAVSSLPQEAGKRRRALELLDEPDLALSVQVLQEFYHQARLPTRPHPMTHEDALGFLEHFISLTVQPMTVELFQSAVVMSRRFRISYWDGAILAAARALDCDAIYTEDLNPEQEYDGLRVIDPFKF